MNEFELRLQQLRDRFMERASQERRSLAEALQVPDRETLRRIAHSLAGNGGIFGFPEISAAGLRLEDALDAEADWEEICRLGKALIDLLPPQGE